MATRSTIAIENADGTVTSVYCHNDGYLDHVGSILQNSYNSASSVRQLLDGGDMSCIDGDYYKDRGDPWDQVKPVTYPSIQAAWDNCQQYFYLFKQNNTWVYAVSEVGNISKKLMSLAKAV